MIRPLQLVLQWKARLARAFCVWGGDSPFAEAMIALGRIDADVDPRCAIAFACEERRA